jgi:hypothetical protein
MILANYARDLVLVIIVIAYITKMMIIHPKKFKKCL